MKKKFIDLSGRKFGTLLVLEPTERKSPSHGGKCWLVRCNCGRFLIVRGTAMTTGNTKSCCICSRAGRKSLFVYGGI